jgi:tRNA-splicing ligase RtcB
MMEQLTKRLMNWASILEPNTREQAEVSSTMPFIFPHLALMPDAHLGMGATVGSVIPTLGAIMPAAVGVDIGCGMIAVRTQWTEDELRKAGGDLTNLRYAIELAVPLSPGKYNVDVRDDHMTRVRVNELEEYAGNCGFDPGKISPNWRLQLGSLGGGNHFIEITVDEEQRVWAFLHSGSRGVGNKIANRHIKKAQEFCKKSWISLPHPDLAYLVEGTDEFWEYIRQLRWAQQFALFNREEMMDRVLECIEDTFSGEKLVEDGRVNCHHNFTEQEMHFGKKVWVSRKGAIEAREGQLGLIPGSMGTASYVVIGRGNKLSLNSSPHGAGRRFSRRVARETFSQADLREAMGDIVYRDDVAFVDEHPGAYKDIDVVMQDSIELVDVVHEFHQIVNVKGQ